jgi:DNA repair protein SbcD/Mre11
MSSNKLRLLHTSDWHLGRALYGQSLLDDQAFVLNSLLKLIDERRPHGLLIAGDLFDRALPPEGAITLFDWFLRETAQKRNTPIFLIPGNHDSRERVGFAASLLRGQNVTIFSRIEDALAPVALEAEGVTAWIYGIPFVEPMEIGQVLGRDDLRTPDEATRLLCAAALEASKHKQGPKVLLCHAFVAGGEVSESEKEIYIGGSSQVDASAFEGFSYTALGHLHKPQKAGRENVRYSGSLLPYSKSEIGTGKTVTEVILDASGNAELVTHILETRRDLRYIEGPLQELIGLASEDGRREDYIIAGFTDDGAVLDAFARLRQVYPNLLHIARAGGFVPSQLPALAREREEMSDLELFSEFFHETTGKNLNDTERSEIIEVLKEATA